MCQSGEFARHPLFQINYSGNGLNVVRPEELIDPRREKDSCLSLLLIIRIADYS
jgi:hypothetical protein